MNIRKIILAGVCLTALTLPGLGLSEQPQAVIGGGPVPKAPLTEGVLNRIDTTKNILVISDMVYGFSALSLRVHGDGHFSGVTSLRPKQKIRFIYDLPKPGSTMDKPRIVTEIWLEKN
jgi:hypothetical protein